MTDLNESKKDRRIRKTKQSLKDGLTTLMKEKSINDISIKELTDLVDLNRGTFYLHYKDIYDMLEQIESEMIEEFTNLMTAHSPEKLNGKPYVLLEDVFIFLKDNVEMCTVLLGEYGDIGFINRIKEIVKKRCLNDWMVVFNKSKAYKFDYYYNFILSGCIGLFEAWLKSGLKESPHEMATLCEEFIVQGVNSLK